MCGPYTGRTEAGKQEFMDVVERMIGIVELEVILCVEGDLSIHVGVMEPVRKQLL